MEEGEDPVVGQPLPVDLRGDEIAHEVFARVRPPVLEDGQQVVGECRRGRPGALRIECDRRDAVGPVLEPLVVVDRHPEDAGDHLDRIAGRDVGDEIGATEGRDAIEQRLDRRLDQLGAPTLQCRRAERLGHEVAVVAVLLAVHADHRLAHDLTHELVVDRARVRDAIAQHRLDVVVAQHHERRAAFVLTGRLHRALRTQAAPQLVGLLSSCGRARVPARRVAQALEFTSSSTARARPARYGMSSSLHISMHSATS